MHCTKRLVGGQLALCEGLGEASYPHAPGVMPTTPPPQSGWEASGVVPPSGRKRFRGSVEHPPTRWGAACRSARARYSPGAPSGRSTFGPPGVPFYAVPELGHGLSRWHVPSAYARALACTYPAAAGTLRDAHGEAIVASIVETLAWVVRAAGAVLRASQSPHSRAAAQFLVDTTPEAIGYQMVSRLEEHGRRVLPAPATTGGAGAPVGLPLRRIPMGRGRHTGEGAVLSPHPPGRRPRRGPLSGA